MNKHNKNIMDKYKIYNIDTNIMSRQRRGIEHHPKSLLLMDNLKILDFEIADDFFHWRLSNNGENIEILLYELDMFFELEDTIQDEIEEIYRNKDYV